ncbi:MAG: hypothetical protein OXI67_09730 [Candidatus Poribacteria bacterium]|nr:hypothetical protein [Candidatus Poribacteria bacterium]
MFRDIFTNKWIIGGVLLLIIIAGGCYFWYQHSLADDRKAAADAEKLLRQSEIERQAKAKSNTAETTSTKASADSTTPTADKPTADPTAQTDKTEVSQTEAPAQTAETAEVRVSPFGFGPYPKVPEGMLDSLGNPYKPIWERTWWEDRPRKGAELLSRVAIKAWQDGLHSNWIGISGGGNGKIYFNYPKTLYVWYGEPIEQDDGTVRPHFSRVKGDPSVQLSREEMRRGIAPPGVRVLDGETEGIDPYEYLDLPTK